MNFDTPEFIDNHSHICKNCKVHVKCGRASSWEFDYCPKCYYNKASRKIDPLSTVVNAAIINPMTIYLNRYTPLYMEKMK